ncbi:MarR family winged helix-turn-helix transcriptional regulator [uncultured Devosia sp.]|uniref:MarR family winged helix-turn-helix transcriptional regulator n=1 Tax=uncultured Devosia sp. TaxID=211434 RepID=UPI0035CAAC10
MAKSEILKNLLIVARELDTGFDVRLKKMGLTSARVRVLLLLSQSGKLMSQASIAEHLRVEPPTAVRVLDGLETLGHINRLADPADRRLKMIALTASGDALAEQAGILIARLEAALLEGLDKQDIAATERVLTALRSKMVDLKSGGLSLVSSTRVLS